MFHIFLLCIFSLWRVVDKHLCVIVATSTLIFLGLGRGNHHSVSFMRMSRNLRKVERFKSFLISLIPTGYAEIFEFRFRFLRRIFFLPSMLHQHVSPFEARKIYISDFLSVLAIFDLNCEVFINFELMVVVVAPGILTSVI